MALAHHDPPHLTTLHQSTSHHQPTTPSHLITLHYLAPRSPSLTAELKMPMALAHHDRQFFLRVSKVALTQTRANPLTTHTHTHTHTHIYIHCMAVQSHTLQSLTHPTLLIQLFSPPGGSRARAQAVRASSTTTTRSQGDPLDHPTYINPSYINPPHWFK